MTKLLRNCQILKFEGKHGTYYATQKKLFLESDMYSLLDLFLLTAEGKHSPDSGERFLCHESSFGISTLLLSSDPGQHLLVNRHREEKVGLK